MLLYDPCFLITLSFLRSWIAYSNAYISHIARVSVGITMVSVLMNSSLDQGRFCPTVRAPAMKWATAGIRTQSKAICSFSYCTQDLRVFFLALSLPTYVIALPLWMLPQILFYQHYYHIMSKVLYAIRLS